jgi:uncharacterized protein YjdB
MKTKQWLLAMSAVIMLAGCGDVFAPETDGKSTVQADGVTLNQTSLALAIGETRTLTAEVSPDNAANKEVLWISKAPGVVSVDEDGVITAHEIGTAIIAVITKDGGITTQCTVKVTLPVDVTGVSLDKTDITLVEGDVWFLTAEIKPSNATFKNVIWSSNNEDAAIVDESGMVAAVSEGSAVITVTTENGGFIATCAVTVEAGDPNAIRVTGVTLNKNSLTITAGQEETLIAVITPTDATRQNVTWRSNNTTVATVDENGVVSALSVGTAVITVRTQDGGKTDQCTVTVNPVAVTGVTLNQSAITIDVGSFATLTATVQPSYATEKRITWVSSNNGVATVNGSGRVSALSVGNAVITVTTLDGGYTAQCTVTVNPVAVTGVTLNQSTRTIDEGNTASLTATVQPSNATNKNVTWSSANPGVATVSSSGVVTAVAPGNTVITVTTQDGNRTANCAVTVNPVQKKIKITNIAGNITDLWDKNEEMYIELITEFDDSNYPDNVVAIGYARYNTGDNSATFSLMDGIDPWKGSGDYYIKLMIVDTASNYVFVYNYYIYTNGQSLPTNYNSAPKLTMNTPETVIEMSKFRNSAEGTSQITITGLNSHNGKFVHISCSNVSGYGTIANNTITVSLSTWYGSLVNLNGETNLDVSLYFYDTDTRYTYNSFNYTGTNPQIDFSLFHLD